MSPLSFSQFSRIGQRLSRWSLSASVLLGFLALWELVGRIFEVRTYLLPTPSRILLEIWKEGPKLVEHGLVTSYEIAGGFLLSVVIAVPLALLVASFPLFDRLAMPFLLFSQTVPKIAVAPLFLVWFGFGMLPKILVAFLICFFPIVIDTVVGLRSVSPDMLDLVRTMGAGRLQTFIKIRLPASLPYLFSGLKIAATLAVVGATVGEFVGADKGLGYLLLVANSNLNTPLLFAAIAVLTLIGIVMYYAIQALEHVLIPWHVSRRTIVEVGTP